MEESEAYKKAKELGIAYIVEDGWIVKVRPDNTRVRIKYIGPQEVKVEETKKVIKF